MPLKPGDRIERYVIDALLGQGGMGEVYRAHDARLQRGVALKILRPVPDAGAGSPSKPSTDGAARMLREARAAAALDHPNVVAIYDVGQVEEPEEMRGTTYLAMELIKGAPLRTWVGDARVPMSERIRWLSDIARALSAAHAAGIIHRDVKPENVMIREDGRLKVLDFGIAKRTLNEPVDATSSTEGYVLPTLTGHGVIVGTPIYMSPEQLRAETLDGRADQFAWGVVAYELLSGRLPWGVGAGSIALVSQILSAPVPPFAPELHVPANVARVVARALAKDRVERFPTMEALLGELVGPVNAYAETAAFAPVSGGALPPASSSAGSNARVVVSERPVDPEPAERAGGVEAPWNPVRRHPGRTLAAALALVGLAGVVAGAALSARTKDRAATSGPSAGVASAAGCTSNRACVASHDGAPYVCRASDHACVAIASEDCKAMYEPRDLQADDTVWLGAMFPTKGPLAASMGDMSIDGLEFARKEIAQATSALSGAGSAQRVRDVALVACDDSADAMRAARHLVKDVGSPAVIGFRSGKELMDLAEGVFIESGVLSITTNSPNPLLTRLPQPSNQPRLVWRTTPDYGAIAEATAELVHERIEPRALAKGVARVVFARSNTVASLSFSDTFYKQLVINGKPAIDGGGTYEEVTIGGESPSELGQVADRIHAAAPTIVVLLTSADALLPLVQLVEARSGGAAPTYVVANDTTGLLAPFAATSADRRHRVFSVAASSNTTTNARFVIRYNQTHPAPISRLVNPGTAYDAFYLLAYGIFALGTNAPVDGPSVARGFARLVPPGRPIEVGPTSVLEALGLLGSGAQIDLEGVASPLDLSLATAELPTDFALFCPTGATSGDGAEGIESGVTFRARTHQVEGAIRCP